MRQDAPAHRSDVLRPLPAIESLWVYLPPPPGATLSLQPALRALSGPSFGLVCGLRPGAGGRGRVSTGMPHGLRKRRVPGREPALHVLHVQRVDLPARYTHPCRLSLWKATGECHRCRVGVRLRRPRAFLRPCRCPLGMLRQDLGAPKPVGTNVDEPCGNGKSCQRGRGIASHTDEREGGGLGVGEASCRWAWCKWITKFLEFF